MNEHHPKSDTVATDINKLNQDPEILFSANATGRCYYNSRFFGYGLSLQGSSHIENGIPCQDASGLRVVLSPNNQYMITAIADGLGSCVLSHAGSRTAVQTALSYCEAVLCNGELTTDQELLEMIRQSFLLAWDAIEEQAMAMNQLPFSFNTTLTLTVYDGKKLHIGHIGDGGVIAILHNGVISLVTKLHKGKSARSVYPLQSGEQNWQFLSVGQPVHGFALATDGVLDSFVLSEQNEDLVYNPLLSRLLFQDIDTSQKLQNSAAELERFLRSDEYRASVSDDITLFIVGNTEELRRKKMPVLNHKAGDANICTEPENGQAQAEQLQQSTNSVQSPTAKRSDRRRFRFLGSLYDYFAGNISRNRNKRNRPHESTAERNYGNKKGERK